jgi:hypothetical protein
VTPTPRQHAAIARRVDRANNPAKLHACIAASAIRVR